MSTFRELIDRTLDGSKRAGLTDGTEVKSLINQVYLEMSALTRPLASESVETLTVGTSDYSLSADFGITDLTSLRGITMTDSGTQQTILLEQVSPARMLMFRQATPTSTGQMTWYSHDGLDALSFWPGPTTTTTSILVTYIARPALLVADADVPVGIPVEFHDVICLGAISRAVRVWNPNYAADYHDRYREGIREYRQWMNRYGGRWAPKAIVRGSRDRLMLPNDVYFSGMR